MEPHVKERIVGAAILVALGVWLIPWVLDGPDEATETADAASDEILPAAAETTPLRTETVELDPAPPASERVARQPDAQGEGEPARAEESVAAAAVAGGTDDGSRSAVVPARDEAASGAGGASGGPAAAGADRGAATGAGGDAVVDADGGAAVGADGRAAAAPASSPVSASSTRRDGWAVQLGAFGDIANAEQLASRVSTYGYSAYVAEFRSGGDTMHRVRVGGFESENEAEAAASSLSAHGFPGRLISPE